MLIMASPERLLVGEQLIGAHPWVRVVGDKVVRFVNPTIEDPNMALLREAGVTEVIESTLRRNAQLHTAELDELEAAGVPVVKSTVSVQEIPVWEKARGRESFKISGSTLGIQIDSEYIYGIPIQYYEPQDERERERVLDQVTATCGTLASYVERRHSAGQPFLRDIYTENQYMYGSDRPGGNKQIKLIDVDPYYMVPSTANVDWAMSSIESMDNYVVSIVQNAPLSNT